MLGRAAANYGAMAPPTRLKKRSSLSPTRRNTRKGTFEVDDSISIPSNPRKLLERQIAPVDVAQTRSYRGYLIPARPSSRGSSAVRIDNSWEDSDLLPELKHRLPGTTTAALDGTIPLLHESIGRTSHTPWGAASWYGTAWNTGRSPQSPSLTRPAPAAKDADTVADALRQACDRAGTIQERDILALYRGALRACGLPQPVLDVLDAWCVLHGVRETRWKPWSSGSVNEIAHRGFAREIERPDAILTDPYAWLARIIDTARSSAKTPQQLGELMHELFGPAARPGGFTPEVVMRCSRRCPIALSAAVLCELLLASMDFLALPPADQDNIWQELAAESGDPDAEQTVATALANLDVLLNDDDDENNDISAAAAAVKDGGAPPPPPPAAAAATAAPAAFVGTPERRTPGSPASSELTWTPSSFSAFGSFMHNGDASAMGQSSPSLLPPPPVRIQTTGELDVYLKNREERYLQHGQAIMQLEQQVRQKLLSEATAAANEEAAKKAAAAAEQQAAATPVVEHSVGPGPLAAAAPAELVEHLTEVGWSELLRPGKEGEGVPLTSFMPSGWTGPGAEPLELELCHGTYGEGLLATALKARLPLENSVPGLVVVDREMGYFGVSGPEVQQQGARLAANYLRRRFRLVDPVAEKARKAHRAKRRAARQKGPRFPMPAAMQPTPAPYELLLRLEVSKPPTDEQAAAEVLAKKLARRKARAQEQGEDYIPVKEEKPLPPGLRQNPRPRQWESQHVFSYRHGEFALLRCPTMVTCPPQAHPGDEVEVVLRVATAPEKAAAQAAQAAQAVAEKEKEKEEQEATVPDPKFVPEPERQPKSEQEPEPEPEPEPEQQQQQPAAEAELKATEQAATFEADGAPSNVLSESPPTPAQPPTPPPIVAEQLKEAAVAAVVGRSAEPPKVTLTPALPVHPLHALVGSCRMAVTVPFGVLPGQQFRVSLDGHALLTRRQMKVVMRDKDDTAEKDNNDDDASRAFSFAKKDDRVQVTLWELWMLSLDGKMWQHRMTWQKQPPLPISLPPLAAPECTDQQPPSAKAVLAKALTEGERWLHSTPPIVGHEGGGNVLFAPRKEEETETQPISIGVAPPPVATTVSFTPPVVNMVVQPLQLVRFAAQPRLYSLAKKFVKPVSEAAAAAADAPKAEEEKLEDL